MDSVVCGVGSAVRDRLANRQADQGCRRPGKGQVRDNSCAERAASCVEQRRRGRVSCRLLALAGADFFWEQRSLARVGRRDGAVQKKLSGPRGHGTAQFFRTGVPFPRTECGAGAGPLASEARQGRYWWRFLARLATIPGRLEDCSRPHECGGEVKEDGTMDDGVTTRRRGKSSCKLLIIMVLCIISTGVLCGWY